MVSGQKTVTFLSGGVPGCPTTSGNIFASLGKVLNHFPQHIQPGSPSCSMF